MTDRHRLLLFCTFHAVLIAGGAVGLGLRAAAIVREQHPPLPVPRSEPVVVHPIRDVPEVVSDAELRDVLWKLRPRFRGPKPRINHVDHALRFWGVEARFDDPQCLSGVEMRELLVDYRQFRSAWGEDVRSLLRRTDDGVRVRVQEGPASSSHVDHTLASLAEVGTPLDYPVLLDDGETTVRALFENARRRFSLNQQEYEWSTLAFVLYAPTKDEWTTTEGQRIDFDRLVHRIVRQRPTYGVCYGNHRLHALVMLLRIDEEIDVISDETRAFLVDYLQGITRKFVETQADDGSWDGDWDGSDRMAHGSTRSPMERRILVTGHVLEWWALAPDDVQPPRDVVVRAADWIVATVDELSEREVHAYYTYLSHAGRALSLWRGRFPHEVELAVE